jgi:Cu/Ag efflux protein CusF
VSRLNANILSLGGIAIAIGAMVDAAVVMIENAHKHLERWTHDNPGEELEGEARWRVITDAAAEVGPALFLSLLIITFSFIPIFSLQGQEGRLFAPLAFTKTYAMAGAAMPAASKMGKGSGTVTAVDATAGKITLDHGAIPAVDWPAMKMGFSAKPDLLKGIAVGDKVDFDLTVTGSAGGVTAIKKR